MYLDGFENGDLGAFKSQGTVFRAFFGRGLGPGICSFKMKDGLQYNNPSKPYVKENTRISLPPALQFPADLF